MGLLLPDDAVVLRLQLGGRMVRYPTIGDIAHS